MSTEGEVRFLSVPCCVGRSARSKILEWRQGLSLSQSAPLGRLDCNESSTVEAGPFSYGRRARPHDVPGSRRLRQTTSSLQMHAGEVFGLCRRALQAATKTPALIIRPLVRCVEASSST